MARKKDESWVRLYRSLMSHPLWTRDPFTYGQAWVDLIMMVCFADTDHFHRGKLYELSRGSIFTSIEYLSKRWHRSRTWTRGLLKTLKSLKMVSIYSTTRGTMITIENYASFQGQGPTKGTTEETTEGTTEGTRNKNVIKNVNNKAVGGGSASYGPTAPPPDEERYVKVRNYATGEVLLYDNQEERYVDG